MAPEPSSGDSRLVLGIDLGSTHAKAVLADLSGTVIAQSVTSLGVVRGEAGAVEQDPRDWWKALAEITQATLGQQPERIRRSLIGTAVSGHFPTLLACNSAGEPVWPALLYSDSRARGWVGRAAGVVGEPLRGDELTPKLLWLKNEHPREYREIARIFGPRDYLIYRMVGRHAIDPHSASRLGGLFDFAASTWKARVLASLDLTVEMLPMVRPARAVAGLTAAAVEEETGIPAGTPVIVGTGDTAAAMIGSGATAPGAAMLYYGTTMSADVCMGDFGEYFQHDQLDGVACYREIAYCDLGPSITWAARGLTSMPDGPVDLRALDVEAGQSTGSEGPYLLPEPLGDTLPNADLRGMVIVGLSVEHGRADLHRAFLESFGYLVRQGLEAARLPFPVTRFVAAGGGARSPQWRQTITNILDRDQEWAAGSNEALGDAMLAAWAVGGVDTLGQGGRAWRPTLEVTTPDPVARRVQDNRYRIWSELHARLAAAPGRAAGRHWPAEPWDPQTSEEAAP